MNNNHSTPLEFLEWLTDCIEQSGIYIAPEYDTFIRLTFAIANSCGEQGRTYFHRITVLSGAYHPDRNDKAYTYALKSGRGINSLGTVYHLAQDAGVEMKKKGWKKEWNEYKEIAKLPIAPSLLTRACEYTNKLEMPNILPFNLQKTSESTENEDAVMELETQLNVPSAFNPYHWPRFLMRCLECCELGSQKDIIKGYLINRHSVIGVPDMPFQKHYITIWRQVVVTYPLYVES